MGLKELKQKVYADRSNASKRRRLPSGKGLGEMKRKTPVKTAQPIPPITEDHRKAMDEAVTTEQMTEALPMGYTAIGKNELPKLLTLKQRIIDAKITAFDYETNGDPEDNTDDPQDHDIVGVSFAYQVGQAFYMPIRHKTYGANWDMEWFTENFLKPILEHPDVTIIAHNIKAEHEWSLCIGIDMFPKTKNRKIIDTMILAKQLQLTETLGGDGNAQLGLKPLTKALLADDKGMVHNLLHVDEIKTFKQTVGKKDVPIPGEFYKSGANKGKPKTTKVYRTFDELPVNQETVDYGCSDSDWALGIYYKLMPVLEAEGLDEVYFDLNIPFMLTLAEYELAGWHIDRQKLEYMQEKAFQALYGYTEITPEQHKNKEAEALEGTIMYELDQALIDVTSEVTSVNDKGEVLVPAGFYGMGEWRGQPVGLEIKSTKPFNWNSTQHKQWLFFHVLGINTRGLKRSKTTGLPGTGQENWEKIVEGYEGDNRFMQVLKEKNKFDKILSTYVFGMLPYCRTDTGKVHTKLNLVSTWRLSSKEPNLQNIPRADNDPMGIRGVFVAPTYDPKQDYSSLNICTRPTILLTREALSGEMVYVNADYSQIELRVLAWYAQERNMIQAFWDGHDFHSATAKDVWNLPCEISEVNKLYKPYRSRAKAINFGLVYGLTEYGLSDSIKVPVDEAKTFIDRYFERYPGVRDYANSQIAFARENGYVQTIFGNRRAIPDINHPNKWIRQSADNKAMNTPIQGSASDIIRLAMVNLQQEVKKPQNAYLKPVMQIHDELQGEAPIEYAVEGCLLMKDVMERPVEGLTDVIPIVAEPAFGKSWQHALDLQFDEVTGKPYVSPKKERKEPTDVTFEDVEYMLELYEIAGVDVRVS